MTKADIIEKFELYMDDTSELSTTEESDLFDKIYNIVCADRPWEWNKVGYSGTASGTTLALPSDFCYLVANYNYTDKGMDAHNPVVFVGGDPWKVVSWSDRNRYAGSKGYAYIDIVNSNLVFSAAPDTGATVTYDYHSAPTSLLTTQSPAFPSRFHDIIYHGMCIDSNIIQMSDKARSYEDHHRKYWKDYMDQIAYWNSNLIQF